MRPPSQDSSSPPSVWWWRSPRRTRAALRPCRAAEWAGCTRSRPDLHGSPWLNGGPGAQASGPFVVGGDTVRPLDASASRLIPGLPVSTTVDPPMEVRIPEVTTLRGSVTVTFAARRPGPAAVQHPGYSERHARYGCRKAADR